MGFDRIPWGISFVAVVDTTSLVSPETGGKASAMNGTEQQK